MAPGAAYYTFDFSKGSKGWDVEGPANFKYNADTGNTAPCVSGLAKRLPAHGILKLRQV